MMGSGACAGVRSQLGVYLTGAIAPAERAVLVRHLAACEDCRTELAGLAALPALLRRPPIQAAAEAAATGARAEAAGSAAGARAEAAGSAAGARAEAGPESGEVVLSRTLRGMARRRRRRRRLLAAGALALAAAAGVAWLLRPAGSAVTDPDRGETVLKADTIGGVTVLTDGEGYTLYWFGRDTATRSACQAGCARRWPPLAGPAFEALGVTGAVGDIVRPDGSFQVTYNGHPLYTAIADTGPAQTKGNGVWSGGGQWHVATMPRAPGRGG